jgi:hypothetical protein
VARHACRAVARLFEPVIGELPPAGEARHFGKHKRRDHPQVEYIDQSGGEQSPQHDPTMRQDERED